MSDRLAAARDYVAKKPSDRFGLYALAMELRKVQAFEECFAAFDTLLTHHPDYGAAYFHYGMSRQEAGQRARALETLRRGLDACDRSGDAKTRGELQSAIDGIEAMDED